MELLEIFGTIAVPDVRKVDEQILNQPEFRRNLAEQIKLAMNSVLEKYEDFGGVEEVLFTEFVVQ